EYMAAEVNGRLRFMHSGAELVMVDIDGFDEFLQEQGNSNADGVIIRFTEALKDIALNDSLIGRMGRDEFVIFIPMALSEAELMSFCEEICGSVMAQANAARGGGQELTASVTAVFSPIHGKDFETLYHKLEMAMYYVKQSGKNRVHFYRGR
ncbi:MAG: GGDEF domain-containing protein, partial [Lachnospiraceae bacterium]|nr:GGDEF domain-containing protein [Lachnospiraceae bacterium]